MVAEEGKVDHTGKVLHEPPEDNTMLQGVVLIHLRFPTILHIDPSELV